MMNFPAKHVFPDTAKTNDKGHLVIGDCSVTDLASQYGTPLYIIDEDTVRNRCSSFRIAFNELYPNSQIIYGSKALANLAITKIIVDEKLGLDVVSGGELALANAGGAPLKDIYFHGNNKSRQELTEAVTLGIGRIVIDSFYEIALLEEIASQSNNIQDVLIRVSPAVDPHTHSYISTGILDSKFGFAIDTGDAALAVKEIVSSPHLNLIGLHCHIGSQLFEFDPYQKAIRVAIKFASEMQDEGLTLSEFSPGGGFGIAYTRDDYPPSINVFASAITSEVISACEDFKLEHPKLLVEPGRSIVGPAGVAVYTTGARKTIPGIRTYLSVDGGMGDNISPALYQASYEAIVANKMGNDPSDKVTIAGKYCESGDILINDVNLAPTEPGDIIAIPASGAYCIPMSSNYNMSPRPCLVLVKDGSSRVIRRRETYEDLMASDVI